MGGVEATRVAAQGLGSRARMDRPINGRHTAMTRNPHLDSSERASLEGVRVTNNRGIMFCIECGSAIATGSPKFCANCGAAVPTSALDNQGPSLMATSPAGEAQPSCETVTEAHPAPMPEARQVEGLNIGGVGGPYEGMIWTGRKWVSPSGIDVPEAPWWKRRMAWGYIALTVICGTGGWVAASMHPPAGQGTSSAAPAAVAAAAVDKYTNNWAGLDAAIADCARQWITPEQFPATGDLMQDAQLLDNAIYAVGTCVTEKNPEYVCQTPEGMTTVCAYSDKSTTGRMIQNADSVDSRLRAVGAPGY